MRQPTRQPRSIWIVDSLREQESNAERIIAEAEAKAHEIINAAEVQRQAILADADREARRRIELFDQQFKEFLNTHT